MKKLNDIRVGILQIPITRIILLVISDCFAVLLASFLSLFVRYELKFMDVPKEFWEAVLEAYLPNLVILFIVFSIFRLYNSVWRYASDTELVNNAIAVVICSIMQPIVFWLLDAYVPRSHPFLYGFVAYFVLFCLYNLKPGLSGWRRGKTAEPPMRNFPQGRSICCDPAI